MSAASCIRYVVGTCGHSNASWGGAINRYLVAVVAARAIWAAVPAAAVLVAAPPVAAAPAPTPPPVDGGASVQTLEPSRPSTPALDEQFLADLTRAGIRIADVPTVIFGGHDTCAFLAAGHTAVEAVEQGLSNNATMTRADEIAYVDAAISVYCPRYLGLTGTLA